MVTFNPKTFPLSTNPFCFYRDNGLTNYFEIVIVPYGTKRYFHKNCSVFSLVSYNGGHQITFLDNSLKFFKIMPNDLMFYHL